MCHPSSISRDGWRFHRVGERSEGEFRLAARKKSPVDSRSAQRIAADAHDLPGYI